MTTRPAQDPNEPGLFICPECQGLLIRARREGPFDVADCSICGRETYSHFLPSNTEMEDPTLYRVVVHWRTGRPSVVEMHTLLQLWGSPQAVPVVEVVRRLRAQASVELGEYYSRDAKLLRQKADAVGLELELIPVPPEG